MQRMMCISEEQYDRMLESYNGAVEELQELRELLQMTSGDVDEVAPVQPRDRLRDIMDTLMSADDKTLKKSVPFRPSLCREGHTDMVDCKQRIIGLINDAQDDEKLELILRFIRRLLN